MEELDIKDFLVFLKKKIWIIVLIVLLFLVGSFIYCKKNKYTIYETNGSLVILNYTVTEKSDMKNINVSDNFTRTYFEVIKSRKVLNKVIDKLQLDINYNELVNKLNFTLTQNTGFINITVRDTSNKDLLDICNTIIEVFKEEVDSILDNNNIIVNVVDEATDYRSFSNLSSKKIIVTSSFVGIFVSFIIVYILYYFSDNKKISKR